MHPRQNITAVKNTCATSLLAMDMGRVCEVFVSVQGEGIYCGRRQAFVRMQGCNLACAYCDTVHARDQIGGRQMTIDAVVAECLQLAASEVSITGGEPLCHPEFVAKLSCALKLNGLRTYLETNGTLPNALSQVIQHIDVVAMDIKLPSVSGLGDMWDRHTDFLQMVGVTECFVKVVVCSLTTVGEIRRAAELVAGVGRNTPLVIQPVTGGDTPSAQILTSLQMEALRILSDVRVIPQCHKLLGVR